MYKIVVITFLGALGFCYRLYKAQKWISSIDYSKDILSNLNAFLAYYEKALKTYKRGSYLVFALLFIALATDKSFMMLAITVKAGVFLYCLVMLLLTGPYIKKVYGKRLTAIKALLE